MLRQIFAFIFIVILCVPGLSQSDQQLKAEGAPFLQVLSVLIKVDREKRKVSLSVEIKNTSTKTIKAFRLVYRTRDVVRGYNVAITTDMPEVATLLAPNQTKTVRLLDDEELSEWILNMPVGEVTVSSISFEDGSSWKRNKD
jgi:hypothetical protein